MTDEAKRLMNKGDLDGLMGWACIHDRFDSSKEDLKSVSEAYEYLTGKGYAIAANNLGSMYYVGRYFQRNLHKAVQYYKKAMEMGEVLAWPNLGCVYFYELKNYHKAFDIFAEGAALFSEPECLYMLGDMYKNGYYVEKSEQKMMQLYQRALNSINYENERESALQGDILCRMGESLVSKDDEASITQGIRMLYSGISHLYARVHENCFVDADIRKYKALLEESESLLDKSFPA